MTQDLKIADNLVVEFHYTLTDSEGNLIDSSNGAAPLPYLHGRQNIVPGLEKELTGKSVGDKLKVIVSPDEAYGEKYDEMVQEVPRDHFADIDDLQIGQQFQVEDQNGHTLLVSVIKINNDSVTLDGNHPLAGLTLHFDVEITSIRPATDKEIEHGHIHQEGESCGH